MKRPELLEQARVYAERMCYAVPGLRNLFPSGDGAGRDLPCAAVTAQRSSLTLDEYAAGERS